MGDGGGCDVLGGFGCNLGTSVVGVSSNVYGVSWGVSWGFPGVSGGFRDDMADRFSKIEGVSSGPVKF